MKGTRGQRMAELCFDRPTWQPQTIWSLFRATAQAHPEREFLVFDDGRRYTYHDALVASEAMMESLSRLGLREGDVVALKSGNRPESVMLSLALSGTRVVKASLNPGLGSYELAFALKQSKARVLFTDGTVDASDWDQMPYLECLVSAAHEPLAHADDSLDLRVESWDELIRGNVGALSSGKAAAANGMPVFNREPLPELKHAFEVSDIMFTSGSTGDPKGAKLSHDMLLRSAWSNCLNRGFEDGRRLFVPLPLFHVYGYVEGLLSALFVGGTLLMLTGKAPASEALAFVRRERANDILCVPSMMLKYLAELQEHPMEFPCLHAVYCSASSCPDWIWGAIRERFGVDDIITGYGMTEVSGASLQTVPGDDDWTLANRVGRAMPCGGAGMARYGGCQMEYRIVDPQTGEALGAGEDGELQCRGATVCYGYCNAGKSTVEAFTEDGWFRTGDIGHFDNRGYLALSGRMKDSYKINGENVSTSFVEKVLMRFPGAKEVAVIGVPDERLGAVGAAFVQLEDDTPEQRSSFEHYCSQSLARYQVPKYYCYLASADWPRTAVGKVRKADLNAMLVGGNQG